MNHGFMMTAPYITMHVYTKRVVTKTRTGLGLDWAWTWPPIAFLHGLRLY